MIAERLGLPVRGCMATVSHREELAWRARLAAEWEEMRRDDLYLLRLGQLLLAVNGNKDATLDDVRVKWVKPQPLTEERKAQLIKNAKDGWLARMGRRKGTTDGHRTGTGKTGGPSHGGRQQLHEDDG